MFTQHSNVYLLTASRQNCNAASLLLFLHRIVDEKSSELVVNSGEVKLIMEGSGRKSEAKFDKGTMVEVKSDAEGFEGSWFTAIIVGSVGKGTFLVEYQMLKTDNGTELLKEEADSSCIMIGGGWV